MASDSPRSRALTRDSNESNPPSDQVLRVTSSNNQHSSPKASPAQDILVYIPDIPTAMPENDLEQLIKLRVETNLQMTLSDIKCYLNLGIALIRLMNEADKMRLVNSVQSMVLDVKRNTNISFVDELDLDSYIVLDRNISTIPSPDEVARRYMQVYKTPEPPSCQSISIQFPNIFRVSLNSFDELVQPANQPDFKISNAFATVYLYADCSFFEDLPSNTNEDKISSAVATQTGEGKLQSMSYYVQYNKETGNAVILAKKSNKKWLTESFLTIDGRNISKKEKLTYRVVVSPVPASFDFNQILKHKLFENRIVTHKHINDHLILELDDMNYYEYCLSIGALRIHNETMQITSHTVVTDPDTIEITAESWYETDMLDIKPDIMTIISNRQHPIFRYKWNAQRWIEQMEKASAGDRRSHKYDIKRHLLRVTVMLNTIGVLWKKKYVFDNEEIILKPKTTMRTIGYDQKAKLSYGKTVIEMDMKTPYPSTNVVVLNEDCLVLYEKLVSEERRPLLLNMANATNPGGGYRKGDGAQEENLFRRSDYYHSLDAEISDKERSERLYCTPNCEFKRLEGYGGFYPMQEFGAVYTSGITVFRQTEANGYAFMKNPLYNVCAIAMAAYRNPELTKENMLEKKYAVNTHKKIENIFAIGYHHNHDCLILSALGCGAFKNPPKHVALLFKSVIYQYAGYFKTIYFAIVDDHNTGNRINPNGNFLPFKEILDGLSVHPPTTIRVNGVSGPNRILNKSPNGILTLSDACITYLPPCQHGSKCRDLKNTQHSNSYLHPPRCSYQSATSPCDQMNDEVHTFTFIHTEKCKNGGLCDIADSEHLNEYEHPDYCQDGNNCQNVTKEHLFTYRHLPRCPDGLDCPKYLKGENDHCKSNRHCKSLCPFDNCCAQFSDKLHLEKTIHTFRQPCPFTPYNCSIHIEMIQNADKTKMSQDVENHCLKYSHVCPFGRQCNKKEDKHYETSIHIARELCPNLDKCSKLTQEDHLESFSHPGIRDIRFLCKYPGFGCEQRYKDQHLKRYRHGKNYNHLSVAPCSNLNSSINFVRNQGQMIRTVNSYADAANWTKAKIPPEIVNWIRALQPVHRCAPHIFQSILVHGHVMSRYYMDLLKKPKYVSKAVLQHSRVRLIFLKHNIPEVKQKVHEFILMLVQAEFVNAGAGGGYSLDPDHDSRINIIEKKLKTALNQSDIQIIREWTTKITQASIELHKKPMGIGYHVDQVLGTDKHIFSILGPHKGFYYGDIVITFKPEIMFHPDANFSIQAGTAFHSGRVYEKRSWLKNPGNVDKRVEDFHNSKLHCSVPRYEYVAATELIAITGREKKTMNVDLHEILQWWMSVDSHHVLEGHLPQLIPLDYIDNVYIPNNIFESLSHETKLSAKKVFKDSLIITDHELDLSLIKPGTTIDLDPTRQRYLQFILDKNKQKIEERINASHTSRGIVVTVPGTKFEEYIILPMTISQSYSLYRLDKAQSSDSPEFTYIYWQAMNGDMMLTISNERIEPDNKDQSNLRCLICYVAEKPSTVTDEYHEAYSYLNDGLPYQHDITVRSAQFKAKSSAFYRSCNTDDFFTFCLKIHHKTGEVALSHAGSNGIYNHQKIQYIFSKSELDLSRIDFIHVSAGNQDVPVRNLMISHERISELHPSFDTNFTVDTSTLVSKKQVSSNYHAAVPYTGNGCATNVTPKPDVKPEKSPSQSPEKTEKLSFFSRIKNALLCGSTKVDPSICNSATSNPRVPQSPSTIPPRLPPCRDSVYCLNQNSKDHMEKYSHPCRFNELCRYKDREPHLIHEHHNVYKCSDDKHCSKLTDPVHRAQYRHTDLPDYLFPCRYQDSCYDTSTNHRTRYFHGEPLPSIKSEF